MNTINDKDLQNLLAELKQLEQDLLETTKKEFPDSTNDAYFKEVFSEVVNDTEAPNFLSEEIKAERDEN